MKKEAIVLAGFVGVSQLAGLIGSVFVPGSVSGWYAGLVRPPLTPPSWLFGPVWILLYAMMGIAAFLVWKSVKKKSAVRGALLVFWAQLALNAAWSILFFGFQSPLAALTDILALWLLIMLMICQFWKHDRVASLLLLPYLAWVSFATYLNYAFWVLN